MVTIKNPTAVAKPTNYRDAWMVGSWFITGKNASGGFTSTDLGKGSLFREPITGPLAKLYRS